MRFYHKYQLESFVRLNHKILSATWDEIQSICRFDRALHLVPGSLYLTATYSLLIGNVEVEHNGEVSRDWCHVLVNGSGVVNKWKCESHF